jgi:hypothetical protein
LSSAGTKGTILRVHKPRPPRAPDAPPGARNVPPGARNTPRGARNVPPGAEDRVVRPVAEQVAPRPVPDLCVACRAAEDWSVLSLDELRECGLSSDQVTHRLRKGWLHRIYPGVYAVGHPTLSLEGRFMAAVKCLGRRAWLARFSAATLWEFVEWDGRHPEVVVVRAGVKRRPRLRVHRTSLLEPGDVTRHKGIPVTAPARTLADLAAVVSEKLLRTAIRRALAHRRVSIRQLVATRRRLGPRRGAAALDRVLGTAAPTRSELEDIVLDLILDAGFGRPDVNKPLLLAGRRVVPDFRWPAQRVVVEADGRSWHEDPIARAADEERQRLLETHGERVVRVTWKQAVTESNETIARFIAAGVPPPPSGPGERKAGSSRQA